MTFATAVAIAVSFWGARDIHPIEGCHIRPVVVEDAALPHDAYGVPALAATYGPDAGGLCGEVMISHILRFWQSADPGFYCAVIVHEVKHADGYGHTDGGLMDANGIDRTRSAYPWPCRLATRRIKR